MQCPETGQGGRAEASLTVADGAGRRAFFSSVASGTPPSSASLDVLGGQACVPLRVLLGPPRRAAVLSTAHSVRAVSGKAPCSVS